MEIIELILRPCQLIEEEEKMFISFFNILITDHTRVVSIYLSFISHLYWNCVSIFQYVEIFLLCNLWALVTLVSLILLLTKKQNKTQTVRLKDVNFFGSKFLRLHIFFEANMFKNANC